MDNLVIRNIKKSFKNINALNCINLDIERGVFGLLGENGAGKTTLMRIIATVLEPDEGEICFGDVLWCKHPDKVRQMIGYLPQEFGIFKNITALECLEYIGYLKGIKNKNNVREQAEQILKDVNLYEYKDRKVGGFSGGMKRRLGIAQALLNNPLIIIVDEPTSGLDPEERIHFRNLLRSLGKDHVILLSTHIAADIEATCQALAVIRKGHAVKFKSLGELTDIAENKVWIWRMDTEDYNKIDTKFKIISTKTSNNITELRIISDIKPNLDAVKVQPTVEEGYLVWNMEQKNIQY